MKSPNTPDAPYAAITPLFQGAHHWRGIGDPGLVAAESISL
jgi:hypothetical protein